MINLRYSTGGFASAIFNFKSYNKDNSITCLFCLPIDQEYARRFNTDLTCFRSGSKTSSFIAISIAHKRKDLGIHFEHVFVNNGNSEAIKRTWKTYSKGGHMIGKTWFKFAHKIEKEANHIMFELHLFADREIPTVSKVQLFKMLYPDSKTELTVKDTGVLLNPSLRTKTEIFEQITVDENVQKINFNKDMFVDLSNSRGLYTLSGNSSILGLTKQSFDGFNNSQGELWLHEPNRHTNLNDIDMRYSKKQLLNKNASEKFLGIFTYDLQKEDTLKNLFKGSYEGFVMETDISINKHKKDLRMADIYKYVSLNPKDTNHNNTSKGMDYLDKQSKIADTSVLLGYIKDGVWVNDISCFVEEVTHHSVIADTSLFALEDNQNINLDDLYKFMDLNSKYACFNDMHKFGSVAGSQASYLGFKFAKNNSNDIDFDRNSKSAKCPDITAHYLDNKLVEKFNLGGSPSNGGFVSTREDEASVYDSNKFGDIEIKKLFKIESIKFLSSSFNRLSDCGYNLFADKLHENKTVLNDIISAIGNNNYIRYTDNLFVNKNNNKLGLNPNNKWLSVGSRDNVNVYDITWFDKGNDDVGLYDSILWFEKSNNGINKCNSVFADRLNDSLDVYKNFTIAKADNEGPNLTNSLFLHKPQETINKISTIFGLEDINNSLRVMDFTKSLNRDNSNVELLGSISVINTNTDISYDDTFKWIDTYTNGLNTHDRLFVDSTRGNISIFDNNKFAIRNNSDIAIHDTQAMIDLGRNELSLGDVQVFLAKDNNSTNIGEQISVIRTINGLGKCYTDKMVSRDNYNIAYDNASKFLKRHNESMSLDSQFTLKSESNGLLKQSYNYMLSNNKYNLGVNSFNKLLGSDRTDLFKLETGYLLESTNTNLNLDSSFKFVHRDDMCLSVNESNLMLDNDKYNLSKLDTEYLLSEVDQQVTVNSNYKSLSNNRNRIAIFKAMSVIEGDSKLSIQGTNKFVDRNVYYVNKDNTMINLNNYNYDVAYTDNKFVDRNNDYLSIFDNTSVIVPNSGVRIEDTSVSGQNNRNELLKNEMYLASGYDKKVFAAIGNKFLSNDDKQSNMLDSKFAYKTDYSSQVNDTNVFAYKSEDSLKKQSEDIGLVNNGKSLGYSSFVFVESDKGDIDIFDTTKRISGYAKYILKQEVLSSVSKSGNKTTVNKGETSASNSNKGISYNNIGLLLGTDGKSVGANNDWVFVDNSNKDLFMEEDYKMVGSKDIGITVDDELSVLGGNSYIVIDQQLSISKDGSTILIDNTDLSVGGGNSIVSVNQILSVEFTNANAIINDSYKTVSSHGKDAFINKTKFIDSDLYFTSISDNMFVKGGNSYTNLRDSMFANYSNADITLNDDIVRLDGYEKDAMINKHYLVNGYNKYTDILDTDKLMYQSPKCSTVYNTSISVNKDGSSAWHEYNKFISSNSKSTLIYENEKSVTAKGKTVDITEGYLWYTNSGKCTDTTEQVQFSNYGKKVFIDTVSKSLNFGGKGLGIFNVKNASSHGKNLFTFGQDDLGVDDKVNKATILSGTSLYNEGSSMDISNEAVTFDKLILLGEKVKMEYYGMTKTARATLFQGNRFGYVKDFLPPIDILKDTKDELILPREQFDYTKYESKVFGENLSIIRKYIKGYTDEGDPIINIPIENPVTYYADIAKDYLDVDVTVMRKVLELLYNNWRKNIHRYAGVEATKAINNILELTHNELKEWYTSVTDPLRIKHAERSLRLFAWYSEMAILTHADYYVSYERADAVFDFWDKLPTYSFDPRDVVMGIKEDEILTFENFNYGSARPYIISSTVGLPATMKLKNVAQSCDTKLTFSAFMFGKGVVTVITDDDTYVFDARRNTIEITLPSSNNEVTIRYSPLQEGAFVDISQFKIKDRYNTSYDLEYTGKVSNVNFTIQYILDVMTIAGDSVEEVQPVFKTTAPLAYALEQFKVYMETHHDKKYKGKRLTIRK